MAYYQSPGVDVKEIDKSDYISGVATSVANIVLRNTYKGPEMKRQLITNESELIDVFGVVRDKIYDIDGEPTAVANAYQDMLAAIGYLQYGSSLYCVRTMSASATFAGSKVLSGGVVEDYTQNSALTLKTDVYSSGDVLDPDDFADEFNGVMGSDDIWMIGKDRGYCGNNTRIAFVNKKTQDELTSKELSGAYISWYDSDVYSAVNAIDAPIDNDTDLLVLVQVKDQKSTLWALKEVWNVSLDVNAVNDQGEDKFIERKINQYSSYIRMIVNDKYLNENDVSDVPDEWCNPDFHSLAGGCDHDGDNVEDNIIIEAYELSENPEEVDVNMFIDSNKSETVKKQLINLCTNRMDAMFIADVRKSLVVNNKGSETTDLVDWRKGFSSPNFNISSSYVATYANWLEVYDSYNNMYRWIPASGHVAGLYAYNDSVAEAWYAPAGLNRSQINNVRRLAWNPNKSQRDKLYINNLNPIVSFAGKGKCIWGQKTMLSKNSAFNRVNVRRLFMLIEKSIEAASQYFVFEQNDSATRKRLTSVIFPFLSDIKARRGVYDFKIVCNDTNNIAERVDRSELWCDIYIKPTKSAEFVVLNFIATKSGIDFSEVSI